MISHFIARTGNSDWDQTNMVSKHKCVGIYSKNLLLVTHHLDQYKHENVGKQET